MQRIREGISELNATDISLIVVVVIGYIVGVATALSEGWSDSTLAVILVSFVMTAVYLALARGAEQYFERYQSGWAAFAYFAVQLILTTLTINLLGPGAWLIALPIAALAVENLSSWWTRGIVYLGILLGASNTFLRDGLWQPALYFVLMLSTAILFAAVLTRLVDSEQKARKEAEAIAAVLEEANRQLAAYSTQIEELARTRERNRMARKIHDNLDHYLTVVNVQIRAAQAVMAGDPQKAQEALENAQRLTQDGLDAVRQSVAALRESALGDRSLVDGVQLLSDEMESGGVTVKIDVRGEMIDLDPKTELTMYRAAQEGLTNVHKHAQDKLVDLTLDFRDPTQVRLSIADNGRGTDSFSSGGYGLLGIRERVEMLGGTMEAGSRPGEGFVLAISLPPGGQFAAGETAEPGDL